MKKYLLIIAVALLSISATIEENSFIGQWKPLPNMAVPQTFILTIKKAGDYYVMLSSIKPDEPIALAYDNKTKLMSGRLDGMHFRIGINPQSGYLFMKPEQGDRVLFKKIK